MSYNVERLWFWKKKGKGINLYKLSRTSTSIPDNKGRFADSGNQLIYPDETIDNGLRIEYTALNNTFVNEDPLVTAQSSLTEPTKVSETSHLNLNRMLSLACVEFIKAMVAEKGGDINAKEYYMREFYKKLADNQSNEKRMFVTSSNPLTSVR